MNGFCARVQDALITHGLTIRELIAIYRLQFPLMQQYEHDTWYDQNGRIVFTASKGLTGVGFPRKGTDRGANREIRWEDIKHMASCTVYRTIPDDSCQVELWSAQSPMWRRGCGVIEWRIIGWGVGVH
jgi:hypothetical protein